MKIAIATLADLPIPPYKGGAVETLINNIINENESAGLIEITVINLLTSKVIIDEKFVHTSVVNLKRRKQIRFSYKNLLYKVCKIVVLDKDLRSLVRFINSQDFDAVFFTSIVKELKNLFSRINHKCIWYLHGDPLSVLPKPIISDILDDCYSVFCVSGFIANQVKECNSNVDVRVILNSSSINAIDRNSLLYTKQLIRDKYSIEKNDTVILFVGRLLPIKGVYELISAFNIIKNDRIKLLIVGAANSKDEIEYLRKLKEISDSNVIFCGYVSNNDINKYYCACDFVVVPSICNEAAPLTLIEAQLCNKRVIATRIGGIPEYAFDNVELINYDADFVSNLASAISRMLLVSDNDISYRTEYSINDYYQAFVNNLFELEIDKK